MELPPSRRWLTVTNQKKSRLNFYTSKAGNNQYFSSVFLEQRRRSGSKGESSATAPYWEEEDDNESDRRRTRNHDDVDDYYDEIADNAAYEEYLKQDTVLEWERYPTENNDGTAWILLPNPSVRRPTCIIHFVGGTFFGSAPNVWYRRLLEDCVKHTQAAVIATSIPVTLLNTPLQQSSPLEHVALSRRIQRQFHAAWRNVVLDEYGSSEEITSLPICGIGHSLGARLLVVLSTLSPSAAGGRPRRRAPSSSSSDRSLLLPPPYQSFILISFTNYGAAAGIPGLDQLGKASRRLEKQKAAAAAKESQDERLRSSKQRGDRRGSKQSRIHDRRDERDDAYYYDNDDYYDDDFLDEDTDWGELFQDLQEIVVEQTAKIKSALTPSSKSLEFQPSPGQLWKALREDNRYSVPRTLVVQFDDDLVDQSSKLATAIVHCSDVKFARLRGIHLTPISLNQRDDMNQADNDEPPSGWLQEINSRIGRALLKLLSGRNQHSQKNAEAYQNLRQSITRYITEIVTKE